MPAIYPASKPLASIKTRLTLGILVCERTNDPPFAENNYMKHLSMIGTDMGILVFVFAPWNWNPHTGMVRGWVWDSTGLCWESRLHSLPTVLYDRSWPVSFEEKGRYQQALHRLQAIKSLIFLNSRMPHKGVVHAILSEDPTLISILPPTAHYEGSASLALWLGENNHSAFLKPVAGSQGRRVIAVVRKENGSIQLNGRQSDNRPFSVSCDNEKTALKLIKRWIGHRAYLMQPLLELQDPRGQPFDIRALLQKNRNNRWTLTGMAARRGNAGTITSNLHGGGIASPAELTLATLFGVQRGSTLLDEIRSFSFRLVNRLEESLGRFAEVGLDYGIDRGGRIWFLEANSKPGRAAMNTISTAAAYKATEQPLSYARSILLRQPGRVIHEFDHL